jgi:hypothetical protein
MLHLTRIQTMRIVICECASVFVERSPMQFFLLCASFVFIQFNLITAPLTRYGVILRTNISQCSTSCA